MKFLNLSALLRPKETCHTSQTELSIVTYKKELLKKGHLLSGYPFRWGSHSLKNTSLARYKSSKINVILNRRHEIDGKSRKTDTRQVTSFPPSWRAVTSCAVNLAMETDFTRCVNSRLGKQSDLLGKRPTYFTWGLVGPIVHSTKAYVKQKEGEAR